MTTTKPTTTTTITNLIFGFGLVIRSIIEIYCEHWFYSKGMPSAFVSLSLYLRIHLSSIPSPMFAPLYLRHIVVLFIHFLVQYHQSQNVKSAVTLLAETTNHSHTHSLSWILIAFVLFLTQLIDSTTTRITQIQRFHYQLMGRIINFIGSSVSLCW